MKPIFIQKTERYIKGHRPHHDNDINLIIIVRIYLLSPYNIVGTSSIHRTPLHPYLIGRRQCIGKERQSIFLPPLSHHQPRPNTNFIVNCTKRRQSELYSSPSFTLLLITSQLCVYIVEAVKAGSIHPLGIWGFCSLLAKLMVTKITCRQPPPTHCYQHYFRMHLAQSDDCKTGNTHSFLISNDFSSFKNFQKETH